MRRRDFMALVGGAVVAIPSVTRAATGDAGGWISIQRIRRWLRGDGGAFRQDLKQTSYVEGQNVAILLGRKNECSAQPSANYPRELSGEVLFGASTGLRSVNDRLRLSARAGAQKRRWGQRVTAIPVSIPKDIGQQS